MAVEIGTAYFSLLPSMKGTAAAVTTGLAGLGTTTGAAGSAAGTALGAGMLASAKKFVAPLAALFVGGALIDGAVSFFNDAITAASDLNESGNAVKVTFGEAAAEVAALGETAAERLGLSQRAFNQLATRFSAFARTIAGSGGDVVGVIDELTTRGADFASVFNVEVEEALTLFQSGLAGETEPLRRYGIDLSAASVQAYAYANGIAAQGAELTEIQKIQARYLSLMAQTANTQGDFANTSNELANANRIVAAEFENLNAELGAEFLPIAKDVATLLKNDIIPLLRTTLEIVKPYIPVFSAVASIGLMGLSATLQVLKLLIALWPAANQAAATFFSTLANIATLNFSGLGGAATVLPKPGLSKIKGAATGAFVPAQAGGTILNVGEGRHDEIVLPLNSSVLAELGASIPGSRTTELGPQTMMALLKTLMAGQTIVADGQAIAQTVNNGNARGAALGAT
jgi:hypothetical protein